MDECWELFRATGSPLFYLLYRRRAETLSCTEIARKGAAAEI